MNVDLTGNLDGAGTLTVSNVMNWFSGVMFGTGRTLIAPGATLNIPAFVSLSQRALENAGTVLWTGSGDLSCDSGVVLTNRVGALWEVRNNQTFVNGGGGGRYDNAGTFRKTTATGTTTFASGFPLNNYGTLHILKGIIAANGGYTSTASAILDTGIGGTSAGTGFGQLQVNGTVALNGALNLSLVSDFLPALGDRFPTMTFGSRTGTFANINGLNFGNGGKFDASYTSTNLTLITVNASTPNDPVISLQPLSQTVLAGSSVTLRVLAGGTAPLSYQWRFGGANITGATNATLTLQNVTPSQAGNYTVVASNAAGSMTSAAARLTVLAPPTITTQPLSQTVALGATVTLSVGVNGAAPVTYQWQLNGANIAGATNATLTLNNVQAGSSGDYRVVMAGTNGAVTSAAALLTVPVGLLALRDNFADRQRFNTAAGVGRGFNRGFSKESGEPDHAGRPGGKSAWASWVAPASGVATFDTRGSSFDTLLAVYTGSSVSTLIPVAGDEDSGGFFTSFVRFKGPVWERAPFGVAGRPWRRDF